MMRFDITSITLQRLWIGLILGVILSSPIGLLATSGGVFGRTSANGSGGCGGIQCHGGAANTNTQISFEGFSDSTMVAPNSTTEFTIIISHSSALAAGVNIGAKTTETDPANAGVLATTGSDLQVFGGELTHTTPKQMQGGIATFTFTWTAPATPGVYFLRAAANAVNRNGNQGGDQWNFAPVLRIRVTPTNAIDETVVSDAGATISIAPVPAHESMNLRASAVSGELYTISVLDLTGVVVFTDVVTSADNNLEYVWHGRTSAGTQAPTGPYEIAVAGNGTMRRGRAVIVR